MKNLKKISREEMKTIGGGISNPDNEAVGEDSGGGRCYSGCGYVGKSAEYPTGYAKQRWNVAEKYCQWISCL